MKWVEQILKLLARHQIIEKIEQNWFNNESKREHLIDLIFKWE